MKIIIVSMKYKTNKTIIQYFPLLLKKAPNQSWVYNNNNTIQQHNIKYTKLN